jgi:hypothetical protein
MANHGRVQLNYLIAAPEGLAEEGRRLFESHASWMKATHPRRGDKALISYNVASAPEPADIWNEDGSTTGRTLFVLSEIYATRSGVDEHQRQAQDNWSDYSAYVAWLGKCEIRGIGRARIEQSLW